LFIQIFRVEAFSGDINLKERSIRNLEIKSTTKINFGRELKEEDEIDEETSLESRQLNVGEPRRKFK